MKAKPVSATDNCRKVGKKLLAEVPVMVNGREQTIECQLDTAASCNVMALRDFQKLVRPPLQKSNC